MGPTDSTPLTYKEYNEIKEKLLTDAKALCKANNYWCVCVAIKDVRNMYFVNLERGYLFTANSETEYIHKLEEWNFDGALVITVYLHEINATTFTKYPRSYIKASRGDWGDDVVTEYAVEIYRPDDTYPTGRKFLGQLDVYSTYMEAKDYCLSNPLTTPNEFYVIRAIDYDAEEGFEVSTEIVEEFE